MKHFYTRFLLLAALLVYGNEAYAVENTAIAFLKQAPESSINNCTPEDLKNLLTDEALGWVESIECNNVNLEKGIAGIEMISSQETEKSFIRINFKKSKLMNGVRCNPYLIYRDNYGTAVNFEINEASYSYTGTINADPSSFLKNSNSSILDYMTGKKTFSKSFNYVGGQLSDTYIESIQINEPVQNGNPRVQFYGFRIFYSGTADKSDVETTVEDIAETEQGEKVYEYFDLMGRRLPEAPESGIYLRICGGKVEKLIAGRR